MQKLQKFYWVAWFPYPSSWLKALILTLFLRVIIFVVENIGKVGYRITYFARSPELFAMLTILLILSPILIISFTHHCIHLLITRFIPDIQAPEIGKTQGLLPGIMSLWEGLYSWLVIVISTLIAAFFCTIIFPFSNLTYANPVDYYIHFEQNIIVVFGILYIIISALIYQTEYLVKQRIINAHFKGVQVDKSKTSNKLE